MIHVERNQFYVKKDFDDMVKISPQFSDLPQSVGNTVRLSTLQNNTTLINKITRPNTPAYGDSEPKGAILQLYSGDIDTTDSSQLGELSVFRCNPDISITEGGFSLATGSHTVGRGGDEISVYMSRPVNTFPLRNEDFEGDIVNVGTIQKLGNNNVTAYSNPYIELNALIKCVNRKHGTSLVVDGNPIEAAATLERTNVQAPGSSHDTGGRNYNMSTKIVVYIELDDDGNRKSFYVMPASSQDRYPNGYGFFEGLVGVANAFPWIPAYTNSLSWADTTTSTVNLEASPSASTENTVFTDILLSRDSTNPYDATDESPLVLSAAELSTEKSVNSGQSFRMYHDWSYSANNNKIQDNYGGSYNLNPQVARATLPALPFPPSPFDIAQNTTTASVTEYVNCNHRGIAPEIQMSMNITKLEPTPVYNISGASAIKEVYGLRSRTSPAITSTHCGNDALSFLRSVTITFSNVKPTNDYDTLDRYIAFCMSGAYAAQGTNIGGITFLKTGMGGNSINNKLIAMPLTVGKVPQATSGTATTDNTIMEDEGMVKLVGNTLGTSNDELANVDLVSMGSLPTTTNGDITDSQMPQYLDVPANSWFKMKMYMDSSFYNNSGSFSRNPYSGSTAYGGSSPSTTEEGERGSQMRIYFDWAKEESATEESTQWDFIDIPFTTNTPFGVASYNWLEEPDLFPKYMTLWVQNYPWVSNDDNTWGGSSTDTHLFKYGDNQTVSSGAAREAEVFIDNIKLINFTPEVTNITANSYAGPLTLRPSQYASPMGSAVSGSSSVKRWANSKTAWATPSLRPNVDNVKGGAMNKYNTGQYLCFGFNHPSDFPTNTASSSSGYFLFNDFSTTSFPAVSGSAIGESQFKNSKFANPSVAATAGAMTTRTTVLAADASTSISIPLGGQMTTSTGLWVSGGTAATQYDVVSGSVHVITTGAAADNKIALGQGSNTFLSTDGFRQKGFMYMSVSGSDYSAWFTANSKMENVLVSTKITGLGDVNSEELSMLLGPSITVQDPTILNWNDFNETYVIYLMGAPRTTANKRSGLTLNTQYKNNEGHLVFNQIDYLEADDGSTILLSEENLPRLWIGPEKYWVNMLLDSKSNLTPRKYTNVCMVEEVPDDSSATQLGSTYNEYLYYYNTSKETIVKSGLYYNTWDIRPSVNTLTDFVIRSEDNGFGVYDTETGYGGEVGIGKLQYDKYNLIELSGLDNKPDVAPGQSFPLYLQYMGASSVTWQEINTDNTGLYEKRPTIYWRYEDLPPVITGLSVSPVYNLLDPSTNLYDLTSANINAVKFDWKEENGDDIWYRLLIIDDDTPIIDKYHNVQMWLPLNEVPESPEDTTSTRYKVYNPSAQTSGNCDTDVRVYSVLDGVAGWCPQMKQHSSVSGDPYIEVPSGTNTGILGLDEFTLVVHWIPSSSDKGAISSIVNQTSSAGGVGLGYTNFEMYKNTDDKIVVYLGDGTSSNYAHITGSTNIVCDGSTPVSLILTYNKDSSSPVKVKLYIDGMLDITSITGGTVTGSGKDFRIGAPNNGTDPRPSDGKFEEIVLYKAEYPIIDNPSEYVFSTVDEEDIDGTRDVTKNARLFAADFHNIRGTTPREIGMSNTISWRATTI